MNERLNLQGSQLYLVSKDIYYLKFQMKLGFEFHMSSIDISFCDNSYFQINILVIVFFVMNSESL